MSKIAHTVEMCTPPVWANLFFIDSVDRTLWSGSVGFHGLPPIGSFISNDSFCAPDGRTLYGAVRNITYTLTTSGSFKANIWVRVED